MQKGGFQIKSEQKEVQLADRMIIYMTERVSNKVSMQGKIIRMKA